jgi:hypothetical protein
VSLTSLAAAAALVLATAGSVPATTPTPPPPAPTIVVQLCIAVTADQVDGLLTGLHERDLVGPLKPLAPIVVPDPDGLALDVTADVPDVHAVLNCGTGPAPTTVPATTVVPTTDPVATTTPAPTSAPTTTEAPATTIVVPAPQVTTIPVGGVATGDGSLAS